MRSLACDGNVIITSLESTPSAQQSPIRWFLHYRYHDILNSFTVRVLIATHCQPLPSSLFREFNNFGFSMFLDKMIRVIVAFLAFSALVTAIPSNKTCNPKCVNSPSNRQCWDKYDIHTDYYKNTPDTGRVVEVHRYFLVLM